MSAYAIDGRDVILEVYAGGSYRVWKCAENCRINIRPELVLRSTVGSGRGVYRAVREIDWSVSVSGVTFVTTAEGDGYYVFQALSPTAIVNGLAIRLSFYDNAGNSAVFTGNVLLSNADVGGSADDFSDHDVELMGNGLYTLDGISDPGGGSISNRTLSTGEDRTVSTGETRTITA